MVILFNISGLANATNIIKKTQMKNTLIILQSTEPKPILK